MRERALLGPLKGDRVKWALTGTQQYTPSGASRGCRAKVLSVLQISPSPEVTQPTMVFVDRCGRADVHADCTRRLRNAFELQVNATERAKCTPEV